jgi:hypothetical protein
MCTCVFPIPLPSCGTEVAQTVFGALGQEVALLQNGEQGYGF